MLTLHVITQFPIPFAQFVCKGLIGKAHDAGLFSLNVIDMRAFGVGRHKKIDAPPFSEKKGMIIRADVIYNAVTSIKNIEDKTILYPCPRGKQFTQPLANHWVAEQKDLVFISGYYEGIDARLFRLLPITRVSLGDFIVNSGDSACAVFIETVVRQLPGVIGNQECVADDSHFTALLEHEQYTQPAEYSGHFVPDVLRSGNHVRIAAYKKKSALRQTLFTRTDLMAQHTLHEQDKQFITEIINESVEKDR